tara:strand:- start:598 stop:717 length:120 start_codon:yes stop_codon:yes gene_type:complete
MLIFNPDGLEPKSATEIRAPFMIANRAEREMIILNMANI